MIRIEKRLRQQARHLYRETPAPGCWIQALRPHICPFDRLIDYVPNGIRILDVGCGSGLLLGLLAANDKITAGIGFDASQAAIERGQQMLGSLSKDRANRLRLLRRDARDAWPEGTFDVVTLIDVLHHVPSASQEAVFAQAAAKTAPGGHLIYKDMASRPMWSALANRLHDLVMVQEWIHYRAIDDIKQWARALGLMLGDEGRKRMYWYTHEWLIFRKS